MSGLGSAARLSPRRGLPVELVFNPNWWHRQYGLSFDSGFYFDLQQRVSAEALMEQVLHERFGVVGIGHPFPTPRPVAGSRHVAGGFVIPAMLGCAVRFAPDAAPWVMPLSLSDSEAERLQVPEIRETSPMRELIRLMDALEAEYGYVEGDFNCDGILNVALALRGQQLYLDFHDNPQLVHHLFDVIAQTIVATASYVQSRTGTNSISVNRMVGRVNPALYLHGNCAVCQISPAMYESFLLPYERYLAGHLQPYGIHHCGDNLQRYAPLYAQVPLSFVDVGWGSDVAACRRSFPTAFLNLRLSPVRMLQCTAEQITGDVRRLLAAAGQLDHVGVCCINMDSGTPDTNIEALASALDHAQGTERLSSRALQEETGELVE